MPCYIYLLIVAVLLYQLNMESDQEAFEETELMKAVDQFDWSEAECWEGGSTPSNKYYQFQPPMQYARYYRLLRVMLDFEQKSSRCLALTSLMLKIRLNNYYALMLRKDCLAQSHINKGLMLAEISFVNYLLEINSKQYQLWTYKKFLFDKFKPQEGDLQLFYNIEITFLEGLLEADSKNYHVWDYKLWLTVYFHRQNEQLQWSHHQIFKGHKISQHVQQQLKDYGLTVNSINWANCYSLWSYRYNLAHQYYSTVSPGKKIEFQREQVTRVKEWLQKEENRNNECGWIYITGLAANAENLEEEILLSINKLAKQIYTNDPQNRFAGNSYLQLLEILKQKHCYQCSQQMKKILSDLTQHDPVREKYYQYLTTH